MSVPAFEGDFLETHEGLIFDVKGILHPTDRKIAYLRYIPCILVDNTLKSLSKKPKNTIISQIEHKFGITIADIRFSNQAYFKIYDIPSRFKILSKIKPEYIFHSNLYDFPLQSVPNQDIKEHHRPEIFLQKYLDQFSTKTLHNLVEFLQKAGNLSVNHIGLSGSPMVRLEKNKSDYDIIIYGKKASLNLHSYLRGKFSHTEHFKFKDSKIQTYTSKYLKNLYKIRAPERTISYKDFKRIERTKTHQFLIDGKEVFIRYLEFTRLDTSLPKFENFSFKNLGRIGVKGVILDDSKSIFTPGRYFLKIMEENLENPRLSDNTIEIFTLRGRFLEQAHNGDIVVVNGKLEQVLDQSTKKSSQRIVIGTDKRDELIQINKSKEKFN